MTSNHIFKTLIPADRNGREYPSDLPDPHLSTTPGAHPEGVSTFDYCGTLPLRRYTHEAQGRILFLPASGLTVVPFSMHRGGWDAVVVEGNETYPINGYCLSICDAEIETAIERGPAAIPEH